MSKRAAERCEELERKKGQVHVRTKTMRFPVHHRKGRMRLDRGNFLAFVEPHHNAISYAKLTSSSDRHFLVCVSYLYNVGFPL